MLGLITPAAYYETVCQINLKQLQQQGIRLLLFDLDNTITTWNSPELNHEVKKWFQELHHLGLQGCILSNNSAQRIQGIANELDIAYVPKARKPLPQGYHRAMRLCNGNKETTVMIGDQLFTDMLGANLAGIAGFLVKPISLAQEFRGTKINRKLERLVMKRVLKKMQKRYYN